MSNLEEHMDEQDRITAACEAGVCDHPECHEDEGEGDSYDNEIVARSAPRWAWNEIDELLDLELDCDGDVVVPGEEGPLNMVQGMREAARAMGLACELANDQPISREDVRED